MDNTRKKISWKNVVARLHHIEGFLLCILTLLLVVDVLLGILSRYIHFETVFATELGQYLFIWLGLVGVSAATRDRQHVRFNLISSRFGKFRRFSWMFSQFMFLFFALFFAYWGVRLMISHYELDKSTVGFDAPMYIFTAAIPVSFALTSIRLIIDIKDTFVSRKQHPWVNENAAVPLSDAHED